MGLRPKYYILGLLINSFNLLMAVSQNSFFFVCVETYVSHSKPVIMVKIDRTQ